MCLKANSGGSARICYRSIVVVVVATAAVVVVAVWLCEIVVSFANENYLTRHLLMLMLL